MTDCWESQGLPSALARVHMTQKENSREPKSTLAGVSATSKTQLGLDDDGESDA
jgi:hypothetical protein